MEKTFEKWGMIFILAIFAGYGMYVAVKQGIEVGVRTAMATQMQSFQVQGAQGAITELLKTLQVKGEMTFQVNDGGVQKDLTLILKPQDGPKK